MSESTQELFTTGKVAENLNVSLNKVKKAILELKIQPAMKKGVCNYYSKDVIKTLKKVIK